MTKQEQMKFHELMAHWWIASATTGICKNRNITRKDDDGEWKQISDEEKVENAMNTAKRHIELYMEIAENWR